MCCGTGKHVLILTQVKSSISLCLHSTHLVKAMMQTLSVLSCDRVDIRAGRRSEDTCDCRL